MCPAKLHFSCKTARKFLNVLAFSNRITTNFFSNLWCKLRCFSTAFQKGSACKFCVLLFALFRQECSQVFGRACFQQPYYGKLFFKLVAQVAVFFNGVSKGQCVQIFVPCNFALFRQECSQVFERACFQQPYYGKRCFKIVAQVAVFFNGVSNGSACKFLCPATLHFSYKTAHKFLNVFTSCNRITTNVVAKFVTCCQKYETSRKKSQKNISNR